MNKKRRPVLNREQFPAIALLFAAWLGGCWILLQKYYHFGYDDWDLAYFTQGTWNILNGSSFSSLFDRNLLGNHSNFISFLVAPLLAVFPHPMALVMIKFCLFIIAGYIFFCWSKEKTGYLYAGILLFLYLIYPPNIFAILYEFDYEALAPAILFLLFIAHEKGNYSRFIFFSIVLMLVKENMPLIIAAFGIYSFFLPQRNKWLWAVIPIIAGLGYFYLATSVLIPYLNNSTTHVYVGHYREFGNSPSEIILGILLNPLKTFSSINTPQNARFIFELFAPLSFLSFFQPQILFLISPVFLQHLLSVAPQQHTIYYNYGITLAPFIFIAATKSLQLIQKRAHPLTFNFIIVLIMILTILSFKTHWPVMLQRWAIKKDHLNSYRWQFLNAIPPEASVIASFDYLSPLSTRKDLYAFHKIYDNFYNSSDQKPIYPSNINYAIFDFRDKWLLHDLLVDPLNTTQRVKLFFEAHPWGVLSAANDIVFLENNDKNKIRLVEYSQSALTPTDPILTANHNLSLLSWREFNEAGGREGTIVIPLEFIWHSAADINNFYSMNFVLKDGDKVLYYHQRLIGYVIFPTIFWKKGDIINEKYWLALPPLSKGKYSLFIELVNNRTNTIANLGHNNKPLSSDQFLLKEVFIR